MIAFIVRISGTWVEVDQGIILDSGAGLGYWLHKQYAVAPLGQWLLAPRTVQNPSFKFACFNSLSPELRAAAYDRQSHGDRHQQPIGGSS